MMKIKSAMENIKLIQKIAWSFHKSTGIRYDELFSEAALAYYEALNCLAKNSSSKWKSSDYDDKQGKMSNYLWNCMSNWLVNFCREELHHTSKSKTVNERDATFEMEIFPENFLNEMSDDCKLIAEMAFQIYDQSDDKKTKRMRAEIRYALRKNGWSHPRIWDGFRELKLYLAKS